MFSLTVENINGEKLQLTNTDNYAVTSITGLNPAPANINTSKLATNDGSIFNSSSVNQRNIVITIYIRRSIEQNRIALYKFFKPKHYVKIYYSNDSRDVFIEGYVETFDGDLFSRSEKFQISIICPSPFFKSTDETSVILSNVTSAFKFPFSIGTEGIPFSQINDINLATLTNRGDVESGLTIEMYANGTVTNPTIYNVTTSEFFKLNYTLNFGNMARITTQKGQKSVKLLIYGVERNLINYIGENSIWLQASVGENEFTLTAESGVSNLTTTIRQTNLFEGV